MVAPPDSDRLIAPRADQKRGATLSGMTAVVLSLYDLGRVPIEARSLAAQLDARLVDLSTEAIPDWITEVEAIVVIVGMHTAARMAERLLPQLRTLAPRAAIATTGLYARLVELPVDAEFGPEESAALGAWVRGNEGKGATSKAPGSAMPITPIDLSGAARYRSSDGREHLAGAVAGTRGCLHRCRHCPVPVAYDGRIHLNAADAVVASIDEQVSLGARHMSFADPDFLNAAGHAQRIVAAMHRRHPGLTWDATIKVEHVLRHRDRFAEFAASGCTFVISAFESVDDATLLELDKGHTAADESTSVEILRRAGIDVRPSWLPFTPWTTIDHIVDLFAFVADHDLVASIDPVQYGIRLLVPKGSLVADRLHEQGRLETYDPSALAFPWNAHSAILDELAVALAMMAEKAAIDTEPNHVTFDNMRAAVHDAAGLAIAAPVSVPQVRPRMTEAWFCCAEPMASQLRDASAGRAGLTEQDGPAHQ